MRKKATILGFGMGMIIAAVVLYAMYGLESTKTVEQDLNEAEIRALATELGMILPREYSDDMVIARAEKLGMIFPDHRDVSELAASDTADTDSEDIQPDVSSESNGIDTIDNISSDIQKDVHESETVYITIKQGMISSDICWLLYIKGIIADPDDLNRYITDKSASKILQYGTFAFHTGQDYESILNTILAK